MDGDSWLSWFFVAVLLCMAAYFAVAEVAVTSVSRIRLRTRQERGEAAAARALAVLDDFDNAISAILIGTNIVHISTATLVTVIVTRKWGASAVAVGTVCCTAAVFFAGEMLPKSLGKRYSERCMLAVAPSLSVIMRVFAPLSKALATIGAFFTRISGGEGEVSVTKDELFDIIETMTDEGELTEERGELVHSALEFGELKVAHALTPRVDVRALDVRADGETVLALLRSTHFSRIPVYDGSIDNIIGILHMRPYIREYLRTGEAPALRPLLDEPCFVHQSTPADELLKLLKERRQGLAVVTDSYGGTVGIVTVEDIIEELVGDIWDEEETAVVEFRALEDGVFECSADMDMEDVLEELHYSVPEHGELEHKPIGEWAYEQFEGIPHSGDSFVWNRLSVTAGRLEGRRIRTLKVKLLPDESGEGSVTEA